MADLEGPAQPGLAQTRGEKGRGYFAGKSLGLVGLVSWSTWNIPGLSHPAHAGGNLLVGALNPNQNLPPNV